MFADEIDVLYQRKIETECDPRFLDGDIENC